MSYIKKQNHITIQVMYPQNPTFVMIKNGERKDVFLLTAVTHSNTTRIFTLFTSIQHGTGNS